MFENINLLAIFTTGLLAGGISCIAVQGGLLTSLLAQRESEVLKSNLEKSDKYANIVPISAFVIAKLVAYTLLGALLGWFGSLFQLNLQAQIILQIVVIIFMVGTALNLLNVHPLFRYFVIQPPHNLSRLIRLQSKRQDVFAPVFLGAFTVFIPCGVTQAMMALAVASGNPIAGSAILFSFVLGTTPVFFLLGYFTMKAGGILKKKFFKLAAFVIILLSLFNLNNALALTGTNYTISNLLRETYCIFSYCQDITGQMPVAEQTIIISSTGYSPSFFAVAAGTDVKINLINTNAVGCQQAFTVPALNIQKIVRPNQTATFTFRAPSKPGNISFMCTMGMYAGVIRVI